jgi:type I restriction enzyme S subunit
MSWENAKLGKVCTINPTTKGKFVSYNGETRVSFLPMEAVEAGNGIIHPIDRNIQEVRKGYTYFENSDVIFAKITPCLQNGKHAIVRNLTNGVGFGSTEFHVIRPSAEILPEWVYFWIKRPEFLKDAENHLQGAVGQQRLPDQYLKDIAIPLPPLDEQRRIAEEIERQLAIVDKAKKAAEEQLEVVFALPAAILRLAFNDELQEVPNE